MLPDFLVIGAQKSGTTSLYGYLSHHPDVSAAVIKETHFFDEQYHRGWAWYRAQFPLREAAERRVTGEATPSYLLDPRTPARVARGLPGIRLVAILRDPVDRAYSQFNHETARGHEDVASFEEALDLEPSRLLAAERTVAPPPGSSMTNALKHHAYLARGRYAEQLERWYQHVPREDLLVLVAEELYADPPAVMRQVHRHLGLEAVELESYEARNQRAYSDMPPGIRERLEEYYAPHNQRLAELLGRPLPWSS